MIAITATMIAPARIAAIPGPQNVVPSSRLSFLFQDPNHKMNHPSKVLKCRILQVSFACPGFGVSSGAINLLEADAPAWLGHGSSGLSLTRPEHSYNHIIC